MVDTISWDDFKARAAEVRAKAGTTVTRALFRGHGSDEWSLTTTLERSRHAKGVVDYYRLARRVKHEVQAHGGHEWKDEIGIFELENAALDYDKFSLALMKGLPDYAYLTYLRHHGFPSPLLDWSSSPYIAAYFAFSAPVGDRVAIYAFQDRTSAFKSAGSDTPAIRQLGPYVGGPLRHFAQRSQYTVCVNWNAGNPRFDTHDSVCRGFNDKAEFQQDVIWKFTLESRERDSVLRELDDYGLNAFTLFGSTDSLMQTLSRREEPPRQRFSFRRGK